MDSSTPGAPRRAASARLAIVAVAALAIGLAAQPVLAGVVAPRQYAAPKAAPGDTEPDHTISVAGQGKVTVTPDMARVQLGVQVQKPTGKAARDAAAAAMSAVVAAIRKQGVSEKDIQTTQVSLSAVYDYPTGSAPVLRGYQLSNQVLATVRDLSKISDVIDSAVRAGATSVDSIGFDVSDRTAAEAQARQAAAADARAKADVYAKALGLSITGVASVAEQASTPIWYGREYAAGAPVGDAAAPTPVLPGSTDITITVQVAFLIG